MSDPDLERVKKFDAEVPEMKFPVKLFPLNQTSIEK